MSFALVLFHSKISFMAFYRESKGKGETLQFGGRVSDSKGVRVVCLAYWFGKYNGSELNSPSVCGVCFFANNESGVGTRAWNGWRRDLWWLGIERETTRAKDGNSWKARIWPIFWIISIRRREWEWRSRNGMPVDSYGDAIRMRNEIRNQEVVACRLDNGRIGKENSGWPLEANSRSFKCFYFTEES